MHMQILQAAVPRAESPRVAPSSNSSSAAEDAAGQPARPAAILCPLTHLYPLAFPYALHPLNVSNDSTKSSNNFAMYVDLFVYYGCCPTLITMTGT